MDTSSDLTPLRGIAYVSTAVRLLTTDELEDLLVKARAFNRQHGVTGVLLYSEGNFMQYFEGAPPSVSAVARRIKASSLHHQMLELIDGPVDMRSFPDWQMALATPAPSVLLQLSTASWVHTARQAGNDLPDSEGMALMRQFWSTART